MHVVPGSKCVEAEGNSAYKPHPSGDPRLKLSSLKMEIGIMEMRSKARISCRSLSWGLILMMIVHVTARKTISTEAAMTNLLKLISQSLNPICPPRPSTAANDSSKKPGYYYDSDYLKRLLRQQRRRIQQEIQEELKPGESCHRTRECLSK